MDLEAYLNRQEMRRQAMKLVTTERESREGFPAPGSQLYDEYHQWAFFYLQKAIGDTGLKRLNKRLKDLIVNDTADRLYERVHDKPNNLKQFLNETQQHLFIESIHDRLSFFDPRTKLRKFDITRYNEICEEEKETEQGRWERIVSGRLLPPHSKTSQRG